MRLSGHLIKIYGYVMQITWTGAHSARQLVNPRRHSPCRSPACAACTPGICPKNGSSIFRNSFTDGQWWLFTLLTRTVNRVNSWPSALHTCPPPLCNSCPYWCRKQCEAGGREPKDKKKGYRYCTCISRFSGNGSSRFKKRNIICCRDKIGVTLTVLAICILKLFVDI